MTSTRSILSISATLLTTALGGAAFAGAAAAAAPVPCKSIGLGKFNCEFYPRGDGISGGTPVLNSAGTRVGYLNYGTNWVSCQKIGRTERSGAYYNHWWASTQANNGQVGWANAVYAKGGANNGPFGGGVPTCSDPRVGSPPTSPGATGEATGGAPGGALPPREPGDEHRAKAALAAQARHIMDMDYREFLRLKRFRPGPFNWADDGCSFPGRDRIWRELRREIAKRVRIIFDKPCEQHDFGYRNFGQRDGLLLGPTERTRNWIDWRLYIELKRACRVEHSRRSLIVPCYADARGIYEALKWRGKGPFREPAE